MTERKQVVRICGCDGWYCVVGETPELDYPRLHLRNVEGNCPRCNEPIRNVNITELERDNKDQAELALAQYRRAEDFTADRHASRTYRQRLEEELEYCRIFADEAAKTFREKDTALVEATERVRELEDGLCCLADAVDILPGLGFVHKTSLEPISWSPDGPLAHARALLHHTPKEQS